MDLFQIYMRLDPGVPADTTGPSTSSDHLQPTALLGAPYDQIVFSPIATVTTTIVTGCGPPKVMVIIGSEPLEATATLPSHHFQAVNGILRSANPGAWPHGIPKDPPAGAKKTVGFHKNR